MVMGTLVSRVRYNLDTSVCACKLQQVCAHASYRRCRGFVCVFVSELEEEKVLFKAKSDE